MDGFNLDFKKQIQIFFILITEILPLKFCTQGEYFPHPILIPVLNLGSNLAFA